MSKPILVTGATGNIGGSLVRQLSADGHATRAFVRDPAKASDLAKAGAGLAVGTFEERETLDAAVAGVDTMVLITAANENAAEQASAAVAAAKAGGVRKLIRLSAIKASPDGPTDNTRQHGRTEAEIKASGLTYSFLRPHIFMQNLFMAAESIGKDGAMYWGMGDGKMGMIDTRDVADCLAVCATTDKYDNQAFELTGPESISYGDVANVLSEALGRTVNYVQVQPSDVRDSIRAARFGDWAAEVFGDYSQAYRDGWGDFTTDEVMRIAGHPPRSITDFAQEVLAPVLKQGGAA